MDASRFLDKEKGERRKEKGERRKEKGEKRKEKGERRKEKGERRKEKGERRKEKGERRWQMAMALNCEGESCTRSEKHSETPWVRRTQGERHTTNGERHRNSSDRILNSRALKGEMLVTRQTLNQRQNNTAARPQAAHRSSQPENRPPGGQCEHTIDAIVDVTENHRADGIMHAVP